MLSFRRRRNAGVTPGPEAELSHISSSGSFKPNTGASPFKVAILTIPKAGTYLLAKTLETLGFVDCEVHLSEQVLSDYRGLSNAEKIARAGSVDRDIPLGVAAKMIRPGQFAVGHILHTASARDALAPFIRIVCVRELRQALASYMRFEFRRVTADPHWLQGNRAWAAAPDDTGRLHGFLEAFGAHYIATALNIHAWADDPDVLTCRFEHLLGDAGPAVQIHAAMALAARLGLPPHTGARALKQAIGQPTLTFSGRRTSLTGLWDNACEELFQNMGGPAANRAMGYENRPR